MITIHHARHHFEWQIIAKHHGALTNNTNSPKSIAMRAHHYGITLIIFPCKASNQSINQLKYCLLCDVRKNTVLSLGSRDKYSTQLCVVLYLSLDPTPRAVFSVHHL